METTTRRISPLCITAFMMAIAVAAMLLALLAHDGSAIAVETGTKQTLCPVMGGPIDPTVYVDHEGKRVYLCCPGCKATFLKNPGRYIKEMESKGIVLEKVVPQGQER